MPWDMLLPNGDKITNIPDDVKPEEMAARVRRHRPDVLESPGEATQPTFWQQWGPTLAAGAAGLAFPPSWPGIAGAALTAGGVHALTNRWLNPQKPLNTLLGAATAEAGGDLVGGAIGKTVIDPALAFGGAAVRKMLGRTATGADDAAQVAREIGGPLPISAAGASPYQKLGSKALTALETGSLGAKLAMNRAGADFRSVVANEIRNYGLEDLGKLQAVADEAQKVGQPVIKNLLTGAKSLKTNRWDDFVANLGGDEARIPMPRAQAAAADILAQHKEGKIKGALPALARQVQNNWTDDVSVGAARRVQAQVGESTSRSGKPANQLYNAILEDFDAAIGGESVARGLLRQAQQAGADLKTLQSKIPAQLATGQYRTAGEFLTAVFDPGKKLVPLLAKEAPDQLQTLQQAYLAVPFQKYWKVEPGKSIEEGVLDGPALRGWFTTKRAEIDYALPAATVRALDRFTKYAANISPKMQKGPSNVELGMDFVAKLGLGGAAGWFGGIPGMAALTGAETASYLLTKALLNPRSTLFQAMESGFNPERLRWVVMSSRLGGQAAGHELSQP